MLAHRSRGTDAAAVGTGVAVAGATDGEGVRDGGTPAQAHGHGQRQRERCGGAWSRASCHARMVRGRGPAAVDQVAEPGTAVGLLAPSAPGKKKPRSMSASTRSTT